MKNILEDIKGILKVFGYGVLVSVGLAVCMMIILSPVTYLCGRANAAYLQQSQGITLPWYQAAFIRVEAVGARIDHAEVEK